MGFTGYFSTFKDFILIAIICYLTFGIKLKFWQSLMITIFAGLTLYLGIFWTFIKPEYRKFLSGGEQKQIVTVSQKDAFNKLIELYDSFTPEVYQASLEQMINRLEYIEFYSACKDYIPANLEYQQGSLLLEAIQHILVPRFINPEKKILDDSELTNRLTGLNVTGADKGTSISLGYMAEFYADFGPILMYIPILFLGFITAFIFYYLKSFALSEIWGNALIIPLFFSTNINGIATAKVLGGMIMYFIIALLINKFLLSHLNRLLLRNN
ncbi:MAG: hypothetical protein SFY32_06990 [Bacteroidota bacterium]|nr:hypothetical protein [Bacteroidota bacterium]